MVEEKKDENVEDLLEKSLNTLQAQKRDSRLDTVAAEDAAALQLIEPLTHDDRPTCSLIQDKPTRSYRRRNKFNLPVIVPELAPKPYTGFWAHARTCSACVSELQWKSFSPRNTSGSDREARAQAEIEFWEVRMLISGHLLFTCRRCLLKAA